MIMVVMRRPRVWSVTSLSRPVPSPGTLGARFGFLPASGARPVLLPNRGSTLSMPPHRYPQVGICIYCGYHGPLPLTDEHIIPLAFGGTLILPDASCEDCARIINREIETPVCHKEWGLFRAKHRWPTRKPRKRPKSAVIRGDAGYHQEIAMGEYSAPVPLYRFVEARVSSGLPRGDDDVHWTVSILTNDHEEAEMQRRYPKWDRIRRFKMQPKEFARLLAKIAHAYVVAECGLSGFWPSNCDII
jgi:5-methylcytosine-specific restriction endonuclease McrA